MKKTLTLTLLVLSVFALAGCTKNEPLTNLPSPSAVVEKLETDIKDQASLVNALRLKGVEATQGDVIEQPFLRAVGRQLTLNGNGINGAQIQVFIYEDVKAAQEDVATLDETGNPKTTNIMWVGGPHWYRQDKLIVVYTADDPQVLLLLEEVLGKQFAGKKS